VILSKRIFAGLTLLFAVFVGSGAAFAADIPTLTWETGREQTVTLGGSTQAALWKVELKGSTGALDEFSLSRSNADGYYVYTLNIPQNFTPGRYSIVTTGEGVGSNTVSYVNVVTSHSYDPLTDPKGVGTLAVLAFSLLTYFSSGGTDSSGQSSDSSEENANTLDANLESTLFDRKGPLDYREGRSRYIRELDFRRYYAVSELATRSRVLTRVVADGTYLQALFGPFSFIFVVAGIALGVISAHSLRPTEIVPHSLTLVLLLILLGVFDALAGMASGVTFFLFALFTGHISNLYFFRGAIGYVALGAAVVLGAGSIRPLRRERDDKYRWERLSDYLIVTILGGWAAKGLVLSLDGLTHQHLAIGKYAALLGCVAGGALFVRYIAEDVAFRLSPARVEYMHPTQLGRQSAGYFTAGLITRLLISSLFLVAFFGISWQMVATLALISIGPILSRVSAKFPNSSALYQVIPVGIPGLIFTNFVGIAFMHWVATLPLLSHDKTRTIAVLAALPGFVIGLFKLFGRHPKAGDTRWYVREKNRWIYRSLGPVFFTVAVLITIGRIA